MSRSTTFALTLATLLATNDAFASTWQMCGSTRTKWGSNSVTMRASSVGFPVGSWRTALDETRTRFNGSPSKMRYYVQWDDTSVAMGNGQSEVWWSSGFGAPAVCYTWWNTGTCQFVEADILFDNTVAYTTSTTKTALWPYGGASRPFRTTAMHEIGHAQGLGHTSDRYSIMGQDWDHIHANGSTATAYPGGDAIAGSVTTYGLVAGALEDLGVAHWRRTGASGAYSIHDRTRVLNSSGTELAKFTSGGEPVYQVNKGQTVRLEMTYENMGKTSPITTNVAYYVSTNSTISSGDTFLGNGSVTLNRGTATTSNTYLVIPSNLTSGTTYYLGVIIDSSGSSSEYAEANNATYTAIRVN